MPHLSSVKKADRSIRIDYTKYKNVIQKEDNNTFIFISGDIDGEEES